MAEPQTEAGRALMDRHDYLGRECSMLDSETTPARTDMLKTSSWTQFIFVGADTGHTEPSVHWNDAEDESVTEVGIMDADGYSDSVLRFLTSESGEVVKLLRSIADKIEEGQPCGASGLREERHAHCVGCQSSECDGFDPNVWCDQPAPPAGLRECVCGHTAERHYLRCNCSAADLCDLAAPSCGHPIDAERLAVMLHNEMARNLIVDQHLTVIGWPCRTIAARIAAAYGEESSDD